MQMVPYKNSSGINGNHQNNVFIVATGMLMTSVPVANVTWLD
jgi:hypothetical protein